MTPSGGATATVCVTGGKGALVSACTVRNGYDAAQALGLDLRVSPSDILNDRSFVGEGYGIPTEAGVEAVRLFARQEGIVLDPIYTGKAAAGTIAHIRAGRYRRGDVIVFVHTGGSPAIFTWNQLFVQPDTAIIRL